MFVNRNHYVIITALLHVYYCRRFLEVEESIRKRILQNFTAEDETKPSQHTKKEEETGSNWPESSVPHLLAINSDILLP